MTLDSKVAIAGYGDAYADEENVKSPMQLAVEASVSALENASLDRTDVDAVLTGRRPWADLRPQWNNLFASYMNIPTKFSTEVTTHGAGVNAMFKYALIAINSGIVDTVLCLQSDAVPLFTDPTEQTAEMDADPEWEYPYGPIMPALYAQAARRHIHEYGTTREQLARPAVEARKWGTRHPKATMSNRGEITVEDVISSRPIAEPLNLLDCAPWGPGGTGGAFVVTRADRAEELSNTPIYVRGVGEYNTHEYFIDRLALRDKPPSNGGPTLTTTGASIAAQQAYEMAGMSPDDMDIVEPSTNFTSTALLVLEDLGFCEKGKAGEFVENGGIDFDGGLPFNTNGGWLSFGQPGISCVMDPIVEAIRQVRGEALGVQVSGAETALTHGIGGPMACNSVSILSTRRVDG